MTTPRDVAAPSDAAYGIVVRSIGRAGAAVVTALKHISPLPENVLAARLFQAPSILFQDLRLDIAEMALAALSGAGLECELWQRGQPFTPGEGDHEVAIVVRDMSRMASVLEAVMGLLGVSAAQAKQILCASPTVLLGRISRSTVDALRRRFEPLGVELDVSRPAAARFDVIIGECGPLERVRVCGVLASLGVPELQSRDGAPQPMIAADLSRDDAERVWDALRRSNLPGTILNRDFQRFDVRLDDAQPSPELTAFIVETTGMPARLVPRVLARLPMVTHPGVRWEEMCRHLEGFAALGAHASGHMLAFQTFSLAIDKVGDLEASRRFLRAIGGLGPDAVAAALTGSRRVEGPLTGPLAQWLSHELKQVGTTGHLVLR